MFDFAWIWMLTLLPLPWLVRNFLPAASQSPQHGLYIPFANELDVEHSQLLPMKVSQPWLLWLATLAWIFLILAVARPQWLGEPVEVSRSGRDVMLAVDLSGSMQIQDFTLHGQQVDRLTATKAIAGDFIQRRKGDRLGLILFASQAYLQTPLTFDRVTVNRFLQESAIGLAGKKTAIGDAIGLAVKRLKDKKDISQLVLILLTDGVNTAGALAPEEAVAMAKKIGLKIHTIGVGASAMQVESFFGTQMVNPSRDLDEVMLKSIAEETGGHYFRAHDSDELKQVYALIDQLEPVDGTAQMFRPVRSLLMYPLAISMLLACLLLVLYARRK